MVLPITLYGSDPTSESELESESETTADYQAARDSAEWTPTTTT